MSTGTTHAPTPAATAAGEQAGTQDQFVLFNQPIVDLRTDRPSHDELLLRVRRADGRFAPPGEFSAAVRAQGIEGDLDLWVAHHAVAMLDPAREGPQLEINISRHSAIGSELPRLLNEMLAQKGVGPDALIVEVAQGELVEPEEMRHFGDREFRLAYHFSAVVSEEDAFEKLLSLHELPFDYVKIDGSFVRQLAKNPSYQAIVRRVAGIASGFGRRTVALHVEDAGSADFLKQAGVDFGQGYFYGKPELIRFA